MASIHRGIHKVPPKFRVNRLPDLMGNVVPYNVVEGRWDWKHCCGCFGGCILPRSCLWFPSLPPPAPSPSSHLSWHPLVSFLHTLLTMAQTHRKDGGVSCPFLHSHVQTNRVIKVTASTWQPPVGNAKAKTNVCEAWAFQIFFSCQQKQLDLGTCI